jgi:hypothetical protein
MESCGEREVQKVGMPAVSGATGRCESCRWSIARYGKLWCEHWDCPALGTCHEYAYEPGAAA